MQKDMHLLPLPLLPPPPPLVPASLDMFIDCKNGRSKIYSFQDETSISPSVFTEIIYVPHDLEKNLDFIVYYLRQEVM